MLSGTGPNLGLPSLSQDRTVENPADAAVISLIALAGQAPVTLMRWRDNRHCQ